MENQEKTKKSDFKILWILFASFSTIVIVLGFIDIKEEIQLDNQRDEVMSLTWEIGSDNQRIAERAEKRVDSLLTVWMDEYLKNDSPDRYNKYRLIEDLEGLRETAKFRKEHPLFPLAE